MRFTRDHEYVDVNGPIGTVGISDHAQRQLGDIVYVELPEVGAKFDKGAAAGVVESVKAASDVFSPVSGEVVEVNSALVDETSLINDDAHGRGWMFKIRLSKPGELAELMDETAYADYLKTID
ncbi:MAG: glycine cleavage system protein GcvH [Roseiarcus sp.]